MDTISVTDGDEFVDALDDGIALSEAGARELWDLWTYRCENGATDYLVSLPTWIAQDKFGAERPVFFGAVEADIDDKGAVLFKDVRTVDPSILEAELWNDGNLDEDIHVSEVLTLIDTSDDEDSYVDDPGMAWSPRSRHQVFERPEMSTD